MAVSSVYLVSVEILVDQAVWVVTVDISSSEILKDSVL